MAGKNSAQSKQRDDEHGEKEPEIQTVASGARTGDGLRADVVIRIGISVIKVASVSNGVDGMYVLDCRARTGRGGGRARGRRSWCTYR